MTEVVKIGEYLTCDEFKEFLNDFFASIRKLPSEIILDCQETRYVELSGYVLFILLFDLAKERNISVKVKFKPDSIPQWFGDFILGRSYRELDEYLSKKRVKFTRCYSGNDTFDATQKIADIIKSEMQPSEMVAKAFSWSIGELSDNAGVHGYKAYNGERFPKAVYITAYNSEDEVELVIADRGQGIIQSLRSKQKYAGRPKEELLPLALEEGVSGHPVFSPGFGLYSCSEIIKRSKSKMHILSNGAQLRVINGEIHYRSVPDFQGTLIYLAIKKSAVVPLNDILRETSMNMLDEYWRT